MVFTTNPFLGADLLSSVTYSERIKIEAFCELGLTNAEMDERLKRSPSTISYELSRCKPYQAWLKENHLVSDWLFPSLQNTERHITEKQFYKVMSKVGDLLDLDYLGTHTMRKTGAYRVYTQSNYNIGLVMHLLERV